MTGAGAQRLTASRTAARVRTHPTPTRSWRCPARWPTNPRPEPRSRPVSETPATGPDPAPASTGSAAAQPSRAAGPAEPGRPRPGKPGRASLRVACQADRSRDHPGDHAGQLRRDHDPGDLPGAGRRRRAHRVQRPGRDQGVEHVLLVPRLRARTDLGLGVVRLLADVRGRDPQSVDGQRGLPRRLGRGDLLSAVVDLRPGHAADPDRLVGRDRVPGRIVQHRRGRPVGGRRDRGDLARLRRQPATGHPRHRLRARRIRRRRGDRLVRRPAQGQDRRARGHRHDHAQLRDVRPALLSAVPPDHAPAAAPDQRDRAVHRERRQPRARRRAATAGRHRLPDRCRGRARGRLAAVPHDDRIPVPHRRRQPERRAHGRHQRRAVLDPGDAAGRRAGRALRGRR